MSTDFPDISHHNATPDFPAIKRAGAALVVLKATEGSSYTDPTFRSRWAAAKAAGLKRSAYHFARKGTDARACAKGLYSIASDAELPLILDWETAGVPAQWCRDFLRELDRLTGKLSIVYTTAAFARANGGSILTPWSLWVARYNRTLGSVAPWGDYLWWQYTDSGTVDGFHGDVSHVNHMPVVDPPSAGVKPSDSPEKIRFLQALLGFLGYSTKGDPPGVYGTHTGEAVRRFKAAHNDAPQSVRDAIGQPRQLSESEKQGWIVGPLTLQSIAGWVRLVDYLRKK